jgi:hypothetical protein
VLCADVVSVSTTLFIAMRTSAVQRTVKGTEGGFNCCACTCWFLQDYTRVPITDEKAPKDSDFEQLIQRLWNVPPDAALVFNCQMGRGRTTTGMVIATLVTLRRLGAFNTAAPLAGQPQQQQQHPPQQQQQLANGNGIYSHAAVNGSTYGSQMQQSVPAWFATSKAARGSGAGGIGGLGSPIAVSTPRGSEQKLKAGMYGVVRSLLRVLERGVAGKAILDTCLDACSAMQVRRTAAERCWFFVQATDSSTGAGAPCMFGVCVNPLLAVQLPVICYCFV